MEQLFNIDLGKISNSSKKEEIDRIKNLEQFLKLVFQIKKMRTGNLAT